MMFACGCIGYIFVLQSLVLYGLYPYVVEQLDSLIETSTCVGVSVFRCGSQWRCECHIVSEHSVASVVIALVVDSARVRILSTVDNISTIKLIHLVSRQDLRKAVLTFVITVLFHSTGTCRMTVYVL